MTAPAVVALACKVDVAKMGRIDRGEILYYVQTTKELVRCPADKTGKIAVVTAEAVTLYKGQKGEVSVPISVLGKTEVVLNRRDETGKHTQKLAADTTTAFAGQTLYYTLDNSVGGNWCVVISTTPGGKDPLGTAVHSISNKTNSVDVIVNFANSA